MFNLASSTQFIYQTSRPASRSRSSRRSRERPCCCSRWRRLESCRVRCRDCWSPTLRSPPCSAIARRELSRPSAARRWGRSPRYKLSINKRADDRLAAYLIANYYATTTMLIGLRAGLQYDRFHWTASLARMTLFINCKCLMSFLFFFLSRVLQ